MDKGRPLVNQAAKTKEILDGFFSQYFRKVRTSRNLRQTDVAERLGVSGATVTFLEKGKTKWNSDNISRFCAVLDIDPAALLREAADAVDGLETPGPEPVADPLRAQLMDIYDRRNLGDMMQMLGTLAKTWQPDEI